MAAQTNETELAFARQSGFGGTLPANPKWTILERSDISSFGNTVSKAQPTRISRARNPRKKRTVSIDSAPEVTSHLDQSSMIEFGEGFCFALSQGPAYFELDQATAGSVQISDAGTVSADQAANFINGQTLVAIKGFGTDSNNGYEVLSAAVASGATTIPVTFATAETLPADRRAFLHIAGVRGASGDIQLDADGHLISTALDFTTLGLVEGQAIFVGGTDEINNFAIEGNRGFARVVTIEANKLTLSHRDAAFTVDAGAGLEIDILFGRYIRNYDYSDPLFERIYYMFGMTTTFPDLSETHYEYAKDNVCNTLAFNVTEEFVDAQMTFVGSITDNPVQTAAAGHADAAPMVYVQEYASATDLIRLSIEDVDENGLLTDFDSLSLTINNEASARKTLGNVAATQINIGKFMVSLEFSAIFTNPAIIEAIRCDQELSLRFALWNDDGGLFFHIPKLGLEGGARSYPLNENVTVGGSGYAYNEDITGACLEISTFPLLPARPCA